MPEQPRIVPFEHYHSYMIEVFGYLEGGFSIGVNPAMALPVFATYGPAFSGFCGPDFLGVAGVSLSWRGVGDAWAFMTPEGTKYPLFLTKGVRQKLVEIAAYYKLHRIHTAAFVEFPRACRWCEALGFESEGMSRMYGPEKQDVIRYVRLFEGGNENERRV